MTSETHSGALPAHDPARRVTVAHVLAAVDQSTALSPTRLRDLRSAVMRVASLLGNVPGRIALDLPAICHHLGRRQPGGRRHDAEAVCQCPERLPRSRQGEQPDADEAMA